MRRLLNISAIAAMAFLVSACGIYSFSGTSIQPDVHTVTIDFFENRAPKVNPTLSNDLTEAIKERFRKMTKLEQVEVDGDLELSGEITSYEVSTSSVSANEQAAQSRLSIAIKLTFTNRKYPDEDFEKSFSGYADFDSAQSLDSVESSLVKEIIDIIVENVFNATVANW